MSTGTAENVLQSRVSYGTAGNWILASLNAKKLHQSNINQFIISQLMWQANIVLQRKQAS